MVVIDTTGAIHYDYIQVRTTGATGLHTKYTLRTCEGGDSMGGKRFAVVISAGANRRHRTFLHT